MSSEGGTETRRALTLQVLDSAGLGPALDVQRLRGGNFGEVWRATTDSGSVVVRFCPTRSGSSSYERERSVLRSLDGSSLPVPRILESNDEHHALVMTDLPGATVCSTDRPRRVVAAAARVLADLHAQVSDKTLPTTVEPMERQLNEWPARNSKARELHQVAIRREQGATADAVVLMHGDFWTGNLLWSGDEVTGVVDWERSGLGHRGGDVAKMRLDLAMLFGLDAAACFRSEYERFAGSPVPNAAYWDARVAIDGYPDPGRWWLPTYQQLGYTHLNPDLVRQRFVAYLHAIAGEAE